MLSLCDVISLLLPLYDWGCGLPRSVVDNTPYVLYHLCLLAWRLITNPRNWIYWGFLEWENIVYHNYERGTYYATPYPPRPSQKLFQACQLVHLKRFKALSSAHPDVAFGKYNILYFCICSYERRAILQHVIERTTALSLHREDPSLLASLLCWDDTSPFWQILYGLPDCVDTSIDKSHRSVDPPIVIALLLGKMDAALALHEKGWEVPPVTFYEEVEMCAGCQADRGYDRSYHRGPNLECAMSHRTIHTLRHYAGMAPEHWRLHQLFYLPQEDGAEVEVDRVVVWNKLVEDYRRNRSGLLAKVRQDMHVSHLPLLARTLPAVLAVVCLDYLV